MAGPPISRSQLKLLNEQTRNEQVKVEREEARQRELERTATLRAQRLAKEEVENNGPAKAVDGEKPTVVQDKDWPWRFPMPHRH